MERVDTFICIYNQIKIHTNCHSYDSNYDKLLEYKYKHCCNYSHSLCLSFITLPLGCNVPVQYLFLVIIGIVFGHFPEIFPLVL